MVTPDEKQQMTEQERELLAYLEDLQATNPAEYELLVEQMQQQAAEKGGKGGSGKASSQGEQVTPTPGFVAKTRSATKGGAKVFINVCQSEHVDKPAPVPAAEEAEEIQMRIPMSLGPPREDLDKGGDVCTVYDCVFHPDAVAGALGEEEFRSFVMQLIVYQVQQKYQDELSVEMTFPKVRGNYKGIAPLPQYMRKKGVPPPPPPGSKEEAEAKAAEAEAAAAGSGSGKGPLVEEVAAPQPEVLPTPSYSVEPRRLSVPSSGSGDVPGTANATAATDAAEDATGGSGSGSGGGAAADGLSFKAHLPKVDDAEMIDLACHAEGIELHVASLYALSLELPSPVVMPPLSVRFERERRILTVLWRAAAHGGLGGGVSGEANAESSDAAVRGADAESTAASADGFVGGWQARMEREKEARLNARRKRAAGNKQLKRQAEAAAEAAAEVPHTAAEAAVESEPEPEPEAIVPAAPSGPPPPPPLMGLTNSIMFELEEL